MEKKYKVFVTEPLPEVEVGLELLKDVAEMVCLKEFAGRVLAENIREVDAIVLGDSKISKESLEGVRRLKVIGRFGVGVDNVDLNACTEGGIIVFNAPGLNAESVAEHVIGMMVATSKKFLLHDRLVRDGKWSEKIQYMGTELWKKNIGIIGLGNIGYLVAKMVKAFDMKVLAWDPYISEKRAKEVDAQLVDLKTLLKESDFVSISCPLTDETRGMINEDEFKLMKNSAILINTARGGIIKEYALYKALKERWIAGAGVDVFETEPVVEKNPLFELDNILLTPHMASWTTEAFRRVAIFVCENILRVFDGRLPANIVNKEVLRKLR